MTSSRRLPRARRCALIGAAAAAALVLPATANAAFTSSISATNVTMTGDDAGDALVIASNGVNLTQSVNGALASIDFDSATPGDQSVPVDGTIALTVAAGGGDDTVTSLNVATDLALLAIDGGAGNDLITGGTGADVLAGGDGDDRVIGFRGNDTMGGGNGNDVLVWNNGDGNDTMDGDGNADEVEVNGAPTAGDQFTVAPLGSRVRFDRLNLGLFNLNISAERLTVNGLGGDDQITAQAGLAPLILLTLDGGVGIDAITGGDGPDLITGGDAADNLGGGAGDDRIVGDRGNDVMSGGAGDDTMVWNNGDGSDRMDGGDGSDRTEVNGAPTAGDVFTLVANGGRARFDRTNLGPFTLDIGETEGLEVNGGGGDDTFTASAGSGALMEVTADGGSGNDTLTGAEAADILLGGSGNDTLTGGRGLDLLDGGSGDDSLRARDGLADLVRCGPGSDNAQTDAPGVDGVVGCERISALAGPDRRALPVVVRASSATVRLRPRPRPSVAIPLQCPRAETGGCRGTLTLQSARAIRIGGFTLRVELGSASFNLRANQRRTVTVRLAAGAVGLARGGRIATRVNTVTRDRAGNVALGARAFTLRVPRR